MKTIYLAGGCFWGVEHFFSLVDGVTKTTVGYGNSDVYKPSYETVKAHKTTAAETVEVVYDENAISLREILNLFFRIIDPTILDRQAHDEGHQYRTGIYYVDDSDLDVINDVIKEESLKYSSRIVTEVLKLENYYKAEEYHQEYLYKNPDGYCHISKEMFELAREYKTKKRCQ